MPFILFIPFLCNEDAAQFAVTLAENGASDIVLAHLSRDNNTPTMALNAAAAALDGAGLAPELIRSYITFQKFEELLEGMKCFLSCYRGCIVNMDHIAESTDEGFLMDNQELVTIRKRGSNAIKKAYLEYLFSSDSE